jgi:hypothetical protein
LSRSLTVESKQLANKQFRSFDNDIQLTGCPRLSTVSLLTQEGNETPNHLEPITEWIRI